MSEKFADWDKEISLVIKANSDVKVAELMLRRHVAKARQAGHSWASIGFALGTLERGHSRGLGRTKLRVADRLPAVVGTLR